MTGLIKGLQPYNPSWKNHGTGGGTSFTLDVNSTTNATLLIVGGVVQLPGTDYTVSGTTVTTTTSVTSGVEVISAVLYDLGSVTTPVDGSVTIAKLAATGTKDATTFLRGDNTFAVPSGGKILQVVQDEITATVTVTGSTSFVDITNLAVAITPASASNKILISGVLRVSTQSGTGPTVKLVRDSTDIHLGDASGSYQRGLWGATQMSTDVERQMFQIPVFFLDSPSTTSEVTYKFQARVDNAAHTLYVNRFYRASAPAQEPRTASNLVAMEIGA